MATVSSSAIKESIINAQLKSGNLLGAIKTIQTPTSSFVIPTPSPAVSTSTPSKATTTSSVPSSTVIKETIINQQLKSGDLIGAIQTMQTPTSSFVIPVKISTVSSVPTFQQYDNQMPVSEFQKFLSGKISESIARENQANEINPSAFYRIGIGTNNIVPGFVLKQQIKTSEEKYQSSLKSEIETVSKYDPRYLVSSTTKGFEFKLDTGIESRKRIAEYDAMNKIVPGSGEGMKFLYGIEGSIESLTTGLTSLFMEKIVIPIHNVISPVLKNQIKNLYKV